MIFSIGFGMGFSRVADLSERNTAVQYDNVHVFTATTWRALAGAGFALENQRIRGCTKQIVRMTVIVVDEAVRTPAKRLNWGNFKHKLTVGSLRAGGFPVNVSVCEYVEQ